MAMRIGIRVKIVVYLGFRNWTDLTIVASKDVIPGKAGQDDDKDGAHESGARRP
jgi:hypothetical protein